MEADPVQLRVRERLLCVARYVQLVVDVGVRRVPFFSEGGHNLPREVERDRLVPQPAPLLVGDDGTLVGDHRRGNACRLERLPHRPHHPPGHHDHGQPSRVGALYRRNRSRS